LQADPYKPSGKAVGFFATKADPKHVSWVRFHAKKLQKIYFGFREILRMVLRYLILFD